MTPSGGAAHAASLRGSTELPTNEKDKTTMSTQSYPHHKVSLAIILDAIQVAKKGGLHGDDDSLAHLINARLRAECVLRVKANRKDRIAARFGID